MLGLIHTGIEFNTLHSSFDGCRSVEYLLLLFLLFIVRFWFTGITWTLLSYAEISQASLSHVAFLNIT